MTTPMQKQITPKYVNEPRNGARSGSIKDEQGQYWGCPPEMLDQFQVGVPVTVDYSTNVAKGKTYYNIEGIANSGTHAPSGLPMTGHGHQPPPRAHPQTTYPASNYHPNGEGPEKQENIFICGVVNNAVAHQSYPLDATSLTQLIQVARLAWRNAKLPI